MTLSRSIKAAWRTPATVWPALFRRVRCLTSIRLRVIARWNGTRLVMEGAVRQAHPVTIQGQGTVRIGPGVVLGYALAGCVGQPILFQPRTFDAQISIGPATQIMNGCQFIALERIDVGPKCAIGPDCLFMDTDGHQVHPERRDQPGRTAPILVEENVWLGARVTILKGVCVGRDAIVAAGAVVTKNVAKGDMVAGNPARRIGSVYA